MKNSKLEPIKQRSQQRKLHEKNEELKQVKAIEIVLTNHNEISIKTFENYESVQSIVMIDTSLSYIHPGSFQSISQSLICLNLSQQHLTDMSFLENHNLPFLKELFLNDNDIEEISNLIACRNLRRLWMHGNKILSLQNAELYYLGDLRELCLQSNLISQIKDLQCLNNLKSLQLASNPICNLQDIDDNLALLPNLKHISFQDIHFGACPVTEENRFRQNLIKKLPQVSLIDMTEVTREERHQHNLEMRDFNDQVEDIYNHFEKEVGYIEEEKCFQLRDLNVTENISEMINHLESQIRNGLNEMYENVQRSIVIKNEKREDLETKLLSISKSYVNKIDKQIKKENELKEMEQIKFNKIKQIKLAEYAHASFASRVEKKYFNENFSLFYLDKNSDDFHWVDLCFRNSQVPNDSIDKESSQLQRLSVQQCYCFLHKTQVEGNQLDNSLQKLYLHGTEKYIDSVFESNVTKLSGSYSNDRYQYDEEFVLFYSSPLRAMKLKTVNKQECSSSINRTEDKKTFSDNPFLLFMQYNLMSDQMHDSAIKTVSLQHAPKSENKLISEMKSEMKEDDVVNFTFGEERKESILVVRRLMLDFLINNNMIEAKHSILGVLEDNKNVDQKHTNPNKQTKSAKNKQQFLDVETELVPSPFHDDYESNFHECMEMVRLE